MCQHIYSVHAFTKLLYIGVSNRDKFHSNMEKCAEERVDDGKTLQILNRPH